MSYDTLFHENYRLLLKFRRKFGTTNIPSRPGKKWLDQVSENQKDQLRTLGRFVETLRRQYKKGKIQEYKVDMLNHINFEWIPSSKKENYIKWKEKIERLERFKETYGHCNVPENWDQDPELAAFVASSRMCYKRSKISDFKIKTLNEIGFEWAPGTEKRKRDHKGRYIHSLQAKAKNNSRT